MAALKQPARLDSSAWSSTTIDLEARLRVFLSWIYHALLTAESSAHIGIHGSATTQTIACVQVDSQSTYVVSDIDLVLKTSLNAFDTDHLLGNLENRFLQTIGVACHSPGARVSSLALDTLSMDVLEASGLVASAVSRGMYCSPVHSYSRAASESSIESRELAPRDVRFAFPYALLRFHEWYRRGPSGYAAAVYEVAKGIDRTLHGDSDLRLASPCIYSLQSLEDLCADQLLVATRISLGDALSLRHSDLFQAMRQAFSIPGGATDLSAFEFDATNALADLADFWPTSILAGRIRKAL